MRDVTIQDVARAAKVGLGTASRALSGNGSVSSQTRRRVLEAASSLNYRPNRNAASLRSKTTGTVALLVPDIRNPFFTELTYWFETAMRAKGSTVLIGSAGEDHAQENDFLAQIMAQRVDGIVISPQSEDDTAIRQVIEADIPLVLIDRPLKQLAVPVISSRPEPGMTEAVRNLASHGHTCIGYLGGPQSLPIARDRYAAFLEALNEHGLSDTTHFVEWGSFSRDAGKIGTHALLKRGVTAILAANGQLGTGVLEHCASINQAIGPDLSLIVFDDYEYFRFISPSISVIAQDLEGMGRIAADALVDCIAGKTAQDTYLPTVFIKRESLCYTPPDVKENRKGDSPR